MAIKKHSEYKRFITEKVFESLCNNLRYPYKDFIKEFCCIAQNIHNVIEEEKKFFNKQEQLLINEILGFVDKNSELADYL